MCSFRAAIAAGAEALETDMHLTKDHVVVLSHDGTLKRCFGEDAKIIDREWDSIKKLTTLKEPKDTMPRLVDLLDLLSEPGNEEIWLLLDIKIDNDAEAVMLRIGETLATYKSAKPDSKPWNQRVVLGIWISKFLPLCVKHLPGYPVMNIGFSRPFSRHFLDIDNVSFNMLFPQLIMPPGASFVKEAQQQHGRQMVAWTVNKKGIMRWCIKHGLDGVITDDPKLFLQVRDATAIAEKKKPWLTLSILEMIHVVRIYIWITVAAWIFRKRFGPPVTKAMLVQAPQ